MATIFVEEIFEATKRHPGDAKSLVVSPLPKESDYRYKDERDGFKPTAGLDMRLGCYFVVFERSNLPYLEPGGGRREEASAYQSEAYVSIGDKLCLQPGEFVLGATLEWLRLPTCWSAYVIGKSSLGRTGLIIETAGMVHPAFTGCLTLEISNLSGVPIFLYPGMEICQIVFHESTTPSDETLFRPTSSKHIISRKPKLGEILDNPEIAKLKSIAAKVYGLS